MQIARVEKNLFLSYSNFDHMIADEFSGCKAIDWCLHSHGPVVFVVNSEESLLSFFQSFEQMFRRLDRHALANNATLDVLFFLNKPPNSNAEIGIADFEDTVRMSIQGIHEVMACYF